MEEKLKYFMRMPSKVPEILRSCKYITDAIEYIIILTIIMHVYIHDYLLYTCFFLLVSVLIYTLKNFLFIF